jgi:hypothetical protein
VGGVGRFLPRRQLHHPLHHVGGDPRRSTRPGGIPLQTCHAQGQEAATPARHFLGRDLHGGRDLLILPAGGSQQHDPSPLDHACRKRAAARPLLQGRLLVGTQGNGRAIRILWVSCLLDGYRIIMVIIYDALH